MKVPESYRKIFATRLDTSWKFQIALSRWQALVHGVPDGGTLYLAWPKVLLFKRELEKRFIWAGGLLDPKHYKTAHWYRFVWMTEQCGYTVQGEPCPPLKAEEVSVRSQFKEVANAG